MESGALVPFVANSSNYFQLVKKDKFIYLNSLWNICLQRKLQEPTKTYFNELLVQIYFMAERSFEVAKA